MNTGPMEYVRSRARVADHGEVFTPPWLVEAMLDMVKSESERIDSRFLEPACGSGNFLVPVLKRKLATVHARYGNADFERRHQALFALMSIYGIEFLDDNVAECRNSLVEVIAEYLAAAPDDDWHRAATAVVEANIVHGDALTLTTREAEARPIAFPEWAYIGKGIYRRRDFRYDTLVKMSSFAAEDTLFADLGQHEVFIPAKDYGRLSVKDIAANEESDA